MADGFWGSLSINLFTEIFGAALIVKFGLEFMLKKQDVELLSALPKREIIKDCENARTRVEICETFSMLPTKYENTHKKFEAALSAAYENGANIRILILAPNSMGLKERNNEIGQILQVNDLAIQNFRAFHRLQFQFLTREEPGAGSYAVKLLEEKPASTVHVVDSNLYHAPFPKKGRADINQNLKIKISGEGSIGHHYRDTFVDKWDERDAVVSLNDATMASIDNIEEKSYPVYMHFDSSAELLYLAWLEVKYTGEELNYKKLAARIHSELPNDISLPCTQNTLVAKLDWLEEDADEIQYENVRQQLHRKYGVLPNGVQDLKIVSTSLESYVGYVTVNESRHPVYYIDISDTTYIAWYGYGDYFLNHEYGKFLDKNPLEFESVQFEITGKLSRNCVIRKSSMSKNKHRGIAGQFSDKYGFSFFHTDNIYELNVAEKS